MTGQGAGLTRRTLIRRGSKLCIAGGVTAWVTPMVLNVDLAAAGPGSPPPGDHVLPREQERGNQVEGREVLPRTGRDVGDLTGIGIGLTAAGLAALGGDEAYERWKRHRRRVDEERGNVDPSEIDAATGAVATAD